MMRRFWALALALFLCSATLAGCGGNAKKADVPVAGQEQQKNGTGSADAAAKQTAYPVTLKDDAGRDVTFSAEPKRVISVAPSNSELVFALGKESSLVGRSDWDDYPAGVQSIESIGSILPAPNYEKIAGLKPDLILMIGGSDEVRNKLVNDYKFNVFVLQPADFDGVYASIKNVGIILNAQEKATSLVTNMQNTVKEISEQTAGAATKPKVFYAMPDESGVWTTGTGTFQDALIRMAGGINVASGVKGWGNYSTEQLAADNPDLLITGTKNAAEKIKARKGWEGLKAVKEGKVFGAEDANLLERPGPRLVQGLKWLAESVHPELFKK